MTDWYEPLGRWATSEKPRRTVVWIPGRGEREHKRQMVVIPGWLQVGPSRIQWHMKNKCISTQSHTQRQQVPIHVATSIWNNGHSPQRCLPCHILLDEQKCQQRKEKSTYQGGRHMLLRSLGTRVSQSCSDVSSRTSPLVFELLPWMGRLSAELSWTQGQKKNEFHNWWWWHVLFTTLEWDAKKETLIVWLSKDQNGGGREGLGNG